MALKPGKRGLVRGATGADQQPAAPRRSREAVRERLLGATNGDSGPSAGRDLDIVVEQHRTLGIRFHDNSAGERSDRIRPRQAERNSGSGAATVSRILPDGRPEAPVAASAFVTSSGMIWTRSTPPCAKFSRKYRPRALPNLTAE